MDRLDIMSWNVTKFLKTALLVPSVIYSYAYMTQKLGKINLDFFHNFGPIRALQIRHCVPASSETGRRRISVVVWNLISYKELGLQPNITDTNLMLTIHDSMSCQIDIKTTSSRRQNVWSVWISNRLFLLYQAVIFSDTHFLSFYSNCSWHNSHHCKS